MTTTPDPQAVREIAKRAIRRAVAQGVVQRVERELIADGRAGRITSRAFDMWTRAAAAEYNRLAATLSWPDEQPQPTPVPVLVLRQAWRNGWTDRANALRQAVADTDKQRDAYERAFARYMSEDPAQADKDPYRPLDGPGDPVAQDEIAAELVATKDALNAAYRERAHLVALLAAVYPSHVGRTDPNAPGWAVVTLQLPTGQAAWHIAPDDEGLFQHVEQEPENAIPWDGHSTEEKYRRIDELTVLLAEAGEPDLDVMAVPRSEIERVEQAERDGDVRTVDAAIKAITLFWSGEAPIEVLAEARAQLIEYYGERIARRDAVALEARDAKAAMRARVVELGEFAEEER